MAKDERKEKSAAAAAASPSDDKLELPKGMPAGGYFGEFGGQMVPEVLLPALQQLEAVYLECQTDERFGRELRALWSDYAGRPSALHYARRLSQSVGGARIYLKREDLLHGNSNGINSAIGQALLAKKLGKKRLVTEASTGDAGITAAMAAALTGLSLEIFIGQRDYERQPRLNFRIRQLGAKLRVVPGGLLEALGECMREWLAQPQQAFYLSSSAVGPHPYPWLVREFQKVIGDELKGQILRKERRLPDVLIGALAGGADPIGLFYPFISEEFVHLVSVEAGGASHEEESSSGQLRLASFHGMRSLAIQNQQSQIGMRKSIAGALCYPAIGPEHAELRAKGREERVVVRDQQAVEVVRRLAQLEGIFCSLESAHAVYAAFDWAKRLGSDGLVVVMLSGSADSDLDILQKLAASPPTNEPSQVVPQPSSQLSIPSPSPLPFPTPPSSSPPIQPQSPPASPTPASQPPSPQTPS